MSTRRGFAWLVWLVAVLAAMTYCIADARPGLAALTLGTAIAAAAMIRGDRVAGLPRLAINLLLLGAMVNVVLRVLSAGGTPVVTDMTDFLVYILFIKLFDRGRPRDEAQLLGLSVFIVIGSVLTGQSLGLGLMLVLFTPLAVAAAMSYQMYQGSQRARERRNAVLGAAEGGAGRGGLVLIESRRGRRELAVLLAGALVMLSGLSVAGFVLAPRTLAEQVAGALGSPRIGAETEFRDSIDLGQGGTIATSDEPVLDLTLRDERGNLITARVEPVYLRGAVLDAYDAAGARWHSSRVGGAGGVANAGGGGGDRLAEVVTLDASEPALIGGAEPGPMRLVQEVQVRHGRRGASPLFAAWRPWTVRSEDGKVGLDPGDLTLQRQMDASGRYSYTVVSAPGAMREVERGELPAVAVSPAVAGLAREIAARAGVPVEAAEREPADTRRLLSAMNTYFRENFEYDLSQTAVPADKDPVEEFLLRTRRGHCEYFAAGMVSMLRSLGVPARIVTGYAASEYNPIAGVFVVRKSDAHAWVEAKVRPDRWETFDPTPPGSLSAARRRSAGLLARLRQIYEAMEFGWINNVVAFESSRKVDLIEAATAGRNRARSVRDALAQVGDRVSSLVPGLGRWSGVMVAVIVSVGAAVGVGALARRAWARVTGAPRWGRRRGGGVSAIGDGPTGRAYARMLRALRRAGLGKPASRPPARHARVLAGQGRVGEEAASAMETLVERFYAVRFGGEPEPASGDREAALLRALEAGLARRG